MIISSIILLVLFLCSALISGSEVAFFSLSAIDIEDENENNGNNILLKLTEQPQKLLATILVWNNFVNIAIVILSKIIGDIVFKDFTGSLSINSGLSWLDWIEIKQRSLIELGLVTFLILLFGEILPKVYASRNAKKFANFMAAPIYTLSKISNIVSLPLLYTSNFIEKRLGKEKSNISVDQLSQALELTDEDSTTSEEQKILKGIVSFGNTETSQIMRPRIDMFAIDKTSKFNTILKDIIEQGFSRIPVYEENVDQIVGVLYAKDLLPYLDKTDWDWLKLIRKPFFVPENKKLDDLLTEFQEKKTHLAIVVDEYGGTSGIVTLEDVIEEIVGDISDEFDDNDLNYSKIDPLNYIFEGKTSLKDFYRILNLESNEDFENSRGEAETIAGFLLEITGGFPKNNDKILFENYLFTIEAMDRNRIKQIKVTIKHNLN